MLDGGGGGSGDGGGLVVMMAHVGGELTFPLVISVVNRDEVVIVLGLEVGERKRYRRH